MENTNFIKVANDLLVGESKLTSEELYLFSYIWREVPLTGRVVTSIDILTEMVKLTSSARYNKAHIKESLNGLVTKGAIMMEERGKVLIINGMLETDDNFTIVPFNKVDELNPLDFHIYTAVKKWENNTHTGGKAKYSYSVWATILECDERTAVNYISSAFERGIIIRYSGKHIGNKTNKQAMQEVNMYGIGTGIANVEPQEAPQEPLAEPVVQVPSEPIQEPVDNTVPPTLGEMLPHLDLDLFKEQFVPQTIPAPEPKDALLDIEAMLAKELGINN
jgi:hypothetical protein